MKQRIEYIDTAKGILILLVVLGHVFETGPINQYIYSFHMPAFFIISGILLRYSSALDKPLGQALLDKIYGLIIPFLFFEVLGVLGNIIRFGVTLNIFGYASNTLHLWCNNGPNWFIWALFVGEVMFILIHRFLKNRCIIWAVTAAIGIFMIANHDFYSTFGSTGVGFLFLTFGYYAQPLFTDQHHSLTIPAAAIVSLVTCFLNGKVDLGPWVFGSVPLYIISALAGTFFVLEGSKRISSRLLNHYGRNTLTVLGTHQVINLPIHTMTGIAEYSPLLGTLIFLGISLIQLPLIFLFDRLIPFLIGKKKNQVFAWFRKDTNA